MYKNKRVSAIIASCMLTWGLVSTSFAVTDGITTGSKFDSHSALKQTSSARIPFIQNDGQVNENVSYYARLFSGTLFVTKNNSLVYSLRGTA